jgi:hypothetical protein
MRKTMRHSFKLFQLRRLDPGLGLVVARRGVRARCLPRLSEVASLRPR